MITKPVTRDRVFEWHWNQLWTCTWAKGSGGSRKMAASLGYLWAQFKQSIHHQDYVGLKGNWRGQWAVRELLTLKLSRCHKDAMHLDLWGEFKRDKSNKLWKETFKTKTLWKVQGTARVAAAKLTSFCLNNLHAYHLNTHHNSKKDLYVSFSHWTSEEIELYKE